jgi:glycerol-1-phosphate dehydrogenase [NAD(P)+]
MGTPSEHLVHEISRRTEQLSMNDVLLTILQARTTRCPDCGNAHETALRELTVTEACGEAVAAWAADERWQSAAVVADTRTWAVMGQAVAEALRHARLSVAAVVVPDPAPGWDPVCDEATRDAVREGAGDPELLVAVGSGVVNDLAKWVAADLGIRYVCVPTAASMNGYCSDNIAATVRGVKVLERGRGPMALFVSPTLLAEAPPAMRQAGAGDVIAKAVSSADWLLNNRLFGSYYCRQCAALSERAEQIIYPLRRKLADGESSACLALFEALTLTGAAMSFAGTSAPASGGEHLVSHALDMMAGRDGIRHDLHGIQVGLGTIVAAAIYERLLAYDGSSGFALPASMEDIAFWGPYGPEVSAQWQRKKDSLHATVAALNYNQTLWPQLCSDLRTAVRPAAFVRGFLEDCGGISKLDDIGVSASRFQDAVLHAHLIRDRVTVLDLAWAAGVLPGAASDIISEWLS